MKTDLIVNLNSNLVNLRLLKYIKNLRHCPRKRATHHWRKSYNSAVCMYLFVLVSSEAVLKELI